MKNTNFKITITRTQEFLTQYYIETGKELKKEEAIEIDSQLLRKETREKLATEWFRIPYDDCLFFCAEPVNIVLDCEMIQLIEVHNMLDSQIEKVDITMLEEEKERKIEKERKREKEKKEKREREEEEREREEEERKRKKEEIRKYIENWIEKNGSDRLKWTEENNYEYRDIFNLEWLEKEMPDWELGFEDDQDCSLKKNPTEEAINMIRHSQEEAEKIVANSSISILSSIQLLEDTDEEYEIIRIDIPFISQFLWKKV